MKRIRIRAALGVVVVCLAVNLTGAKLATGFGWLLFLDSIGTVLAALLGGLLPGGGSSVSSGRRCSAPCPSRSSAAGWARS